MVVVSYLIPTYLMYRTFAGKSSISSVVGSINSTYKTIRNVFSEKCYTVDTFIEGIDLGYKIKTYKNFLLDLDKNLKQKELEKHKSIMGALEGLGEIINTIDIDLENIRIKISRHDRKWLSGWRTINCNRELDVLKNHVSMTDSRFDTLVKLLNLKNINEEVLKNQTNVINNQTSALENKFDSLIDIMKKK
jgi:hypothetical protein